MIRPTRFPKRVAYGARVHAPLYYVTSRSIDRLSGRIARRLVRQAALEIEMREACRDRRAWAGKLRIVPSNRTTVHRSRSRSGSTGHG